MKKICEVSLLLLVLAISCRGQYVPPEATVMPLYPKGLRMFIPDEDGIRLVAFHVKFNEDFNGLEAGTIARDIIKKRDGRWTYEDKTTKLKPGDTIYYWLHVVYEGLGYNLVDQQYNVTRYYNEDGTPVKFNYNPEENRPCSASLTQLKVPEAGGRKVCTGELLFEDHFDNVNESAWLVNERFSTGPDYEFVIYKRDNENVKAVNGQLQVTPTLTEKTYGNRFVRYGNLTLEQCTGQKGTEECNKQALGSSILPPVLSGRLDTSRTFAFTYGKVEIRAKLPSGDWIYPVLALEPLTEASYQGGYRRDPSRFIRIAGAIGNRNFPCNREERGSQVLTGGPSLLSESRWNTMRKTQSSTPWSEDFHIYQLDWTPERVILRVDGEMYGRIDTADAFDGPFYLTLGVAVGGHVEFPDGCGPAYFKPWRNLGSKAIYNFFEASNQWISTWKNGPTTLLVDYVKVWAL
ncbi:beta-1,3-glucan-binding protein 1 isoform X2 [Orussus abietinus]|nr:beta-1,3-glucan-binding protein 1 isoform X2 [Orussus abietinus]XP_012272887.1 beta-1,3-glucan-binding protein 1 isoform X2 [Orussus abietinus]XP_023290414.1 beta-1,3-glucan-binding protein 1 isoform X2 [Orussus abietinus]